MQDFMFIRFRRGYQQIALSKILYFQANGHYTKLITYESSYDVYISIKQLESALPPECFCRVHRSYLVSVEKVQFFDETVLIIHDKPLPLSRHYRKNFLGRIQLLIGHPQPTRLLLEADNLIMNN